VPSVSAGCGHLRQLDGRRLVPGAASRPSFIIVPAARTRRGRPRGASRPPDAIARDPLRTESGCAPPVPGRSQCILSGSRRGCQGRDIHCGRSAASAYGSRGPDMRPCGAGGLHISTVTKHPMDGRTRWLKVALLSIAVPGGARRSPAVMDIKSTAGRLLDGRPIRRCAFHKQIGRRGQRVSSTRGPPRSNPRSMFPRGSGQELLNHADQWVGATHARRVRCASREGRCSSGAPRSTPRDHGARCETPGDPGHSARTPRTTATVRVDEELLNSGRDDDGDGRVER
jgi:hypothetical protein